MAKLKCKICEKKIQKGILDKIQGTHITNNSKQYVICSDCQANYTLDEIKQKL